MIKHFGVYYNGTRVTVIEAHSAVVRNGSVRLLSESGEEIATVYAYMDVICEEDSNWVVPPAEEEGIDMKCPLCQTTVTKVVEGDKDPSAEIVCQNEFYAHYRFQNGNSRLIRYKNPRVNPQEVRFKMAI